MSGDTLRVIDAVLAIAGVVVVGFGLAEGWRTFIVWKWVTVAFLAFHCLLAIVLLDAAHDPTLPDYTHGAPWRLYALTLGLLFVVLAASAATWHTWRHPRRP